MRPMSATLVCLLLCGFLTPMPAVGRSAAASAAHSSMRVGERTAGTCTPNTSLYFVDASTETIASGADADVVSTLFLQNPNPASVPFTITYYIEGTTTRTVSIQRTLEPSTVLSESVNDDVGPGVRVSAQVSATAPIAATLVVTRSNATGPLAATSEPGQVVALPGTQSTYTYAFAGGEDLPTTDEYLVLLNPTNSAAHLTITFLPQSDSTNTAAPISLPPITLSINAASRTTAPISREIDQQLQHSGNVHGLSFGMVVSSDTPLAAVRTEYLGNGSGMGRYGVTTELPTSTFARMFTFASDISSGSNSAVGTGNDQSELDVINPADAASGAATVRVLALDQQGSLINSAEFSIDGGTRQTLALNDIAGTQPNVFSVVVTSDRNIAVEKRVSYGGDPRLGGTFATSAVSGLPSGLTAVAFPFLALSLGNTPISQNVFLYNPGPLAIVVQATYVAAGRAQPFTETYSVPPKGITTVDVNNDARSLPAGPLGAVFQLAPASSGTGSSFVAMAQANSAQFAGVIGQEPTIGFPPPTGFAYCPPAAGAPTVTDASLGVTLRLPPGWVQAPAGQYAPGMTLVIPAPRGVSEDNLRLAIQPLASYAGRGGLAAAANDLMRGQPGRMTPVGSSVAGLPAIKLLGMPGAQPNVQVIAASSFGAYYDIIAFGGLGLAGDQQAALASLTFSRPSGAGLTPTTDGSQGTGNNPPQVRTVLRIRETARPSIDPDAFEQQPPSSTTLPGLSVFWDATARAARYAPRALLLPNGAIPAGARPGYFYLARPYNAFTTSTQYTNDGYAIDWPIDTGYPLFSQNNGTDATVLYAGYAQGGWTRYGKMVVVGYGRLGPQAWSVVALYADLKSTAAGLRFQMPLTAYAAIGTSGYSGSSAFTGAYPHVMAAEYTGNVQFISTPLGLEPYGGTALKPEPLYRRYKSRSFYGQLHSGEVVMP